MPSPPLPRPTRPQPSLRGNRVQGVQSVPRSPGPDCRFHRTHRRPEPRGLLHPARSFFSRDRVARPEAHSYEASKPRLQPVPGHQPPRELTSLQLETHPPCKRSAGRRAPKACPCPPGAARPSQEAACSPGPPASGAPPIMCVGSHSEIYSLLQNKCHPLGLEPGHQVTRAAVMPPVSCPGMRCA